MGKHGSIRKGILMMKPVQTYRGDAIASMYLTESRLFALYRPMRDGGSPLTKPQIDEAKELMEKEYG